MSSGRDFLMRLARMTRELGRSQALELVRHVVNVGPMQRV